jgi:hypothetical protein
LKDSVSCVYFGVGVWRMWYVREKERERGKRVQLIVRQRDEDRRG